jgi:adenylyltransferase/sulfurtransferase
VEDLLDGIDLALDGTDNFEARYLLNDACVKTGTSWIYTACVGSYGLSFVIRPGITPCLRCLMEEEPPPGTSPTCDTAGIIAPVVHAIAAFQVAEALKILSGREDALLGKLTSIDLWTGSLGSFQPSAPRKDCPACGRGHFEHLAGDREARTATLCGRNAVQIRPGGGSVIALDQVASRLQALGEVKVNPHLLRFKTEGKELVVFADGRAIIHGTDDPTEARSLYARYIGN